MIKIQEVLFEKQAKVIAYLETQMSLEHTGHLPWELINYVTYDINNPFIQKVECGLCGTHLETYTHKHNEDYTYYETVFCQSCYSKLDAYSI